MSVVLSTDDNLISSESFLSEIKTQQDLFQTVEESEVISPVRDTIQVKDYAYTLTLRRHDFETEKEYLSFIKCVERSVRSSVEYKLWLNYLREALNCRYCQVTGESLSDVSVEVHHHPLSLFLMCKLVVEDKISKSEGFSSFDIAQDILNLHFNMKVGFILLVKTLHEKFHSGSFNIPIEYVRGDYQYLLDSYLRYANEDELNLVTSYLSINKENCGWSLKWPINTNK